MTVCIYRYIHTTTFYYWRQWVLFRWTFPW